MMKSLASWSLVLVLVGLTGCSYLRLQRPSRSTASDWVMYGRDAGRTNIARDVVQPPLRRVWEYDASAGFSPYAAVAVDNIVFVGNLRGEVHAIDLRTGEGLGARGFGSAIVGAPVLQNEVMYVVLAHDHESLLAYNVRNGSFEWKAELRDIEASPLLLGKRLYVATLNGKLHCFEASNGKEVWTYELPQTVKKRGIRSSPASDGDIVVFGCDDGAIYAVGADDGAFRWSAKTRASVFAPPSVAAGRVFVGSLDSSFYAFDARTGEQVWTRNLGARIFSSQAVDSRHVYVGTVGRTIFCLDIDDGSIIWTAKANGAISSPPLVSGNTVFVGSIDKTLYALDVETGAVRWQQTLEGRIKSMPIAVRDHLIVLTEDRSVVAFTHSDVP